MDYDLEAKAKQIAEVLELDAPEAGLLKAVMQNAYLYGQKDGLEKARKIHEDAVND